MVRVELSGSEHLESTTSYVLASNHQSLFDTAVLFACLPLPFRVLYKKELNKIPFLGWHLSLGGHIGIDRDNPMQARQSLNAAAERVRAGTSVVVFPEGTRSYQGVMSRFKKGSFRLAIKAATPVVPITILDSYKIMTRGRLTVCPGTVQVTIGRPISVDALVEDDAGRLAERAEAVVLRTLRAR